MPGLRIVPQSLFELGQSNVGEAPVSCGNGTADLGVKDAAHWAVIVAFGISLILGTGIDLGLGLGIGDVF